MREIKFRAWDGTRAELGKSDFALSSWVQKYESLVADLERTRSDLDQVKEYSEFLKGIVNSHDTHLEKMITDYLLIIEQERNRAEMYLVELTKLSSFSTKPELIILTEV